MRRTIYPEKGMPVPIGYYELCELCGEPFARVDFIGDQYVPRYMPPHVCEQMLERILGLLNYRIQFVKR